MWSDLYLTGRLHDYTPKSSPCASLDISNAVCIIKVKETFEATQVQLIVAVHGT